MFESSVEPGSGEAPAPAAGARDWASRHPLAADLEVTPPGPGLAFTMAALEPADLDDAALVEAVAAWERLVSWSSAGQARAVAELARRRPLVRSPFVADEVASRLNVTRSVADAKVALALGLQRLPVVESALGRGDLDVRRATVVTDELGRLPEHVAEELAAGAVVAGVDATAPQLRNRLRRLELLRDPEGVVVRHRRACEQRRVELTPAADAMAWLTAYLPATDAVAVQTTLTALAEHTDTDEDQRSLDQRRADALVDLATRWLDAGDHPEGGPLRSRQGRLPHVTITATARTVVGLEDSPAILEGYGVIPPGLARMVAARATWEPLLVSARSGEPLARSTRRYAPTQELRDAVVQRDRTCRFPGCRMPAQRCDLDHVDPFEQSRTGEHQTSSENLHALCRHHHLAKTHGGWAAHPAEGGARIWTSPTGHTYAQHREQPLEDSAEGIPEHAGAVPQPPEGIPEGPDGEADPRARPGRQVDDPPVSPPERPELGMSSRVREVSRPAQERPHADGRHGPAADEDEGGSPPF